jgi:hypothetical protein
VDLPRLMTDVHKYEDNVKTTGELDPDGWTGIAS